jgi:hypothetical protein
VQADQDAQTDGLVPLASAGSELTELRATCLRQAGRIDGQHDAITTMRAAAAVFEAENSVLRAENFRMRDRRSRFAREEPAIEPPERHEVRIALDTHAPAAVRRVVTKLLRDRAPAPVLSDARLLGSELATDVVLHSGATPDAGLVLRIELSRNVVRLEVEAPGVAPRTARALGAMRLVHLLSERWGVEHATAGPTRAWAQLSLDVGPQPSRVRA